MATLQAIVVPASGRQSATFIFLHGLGDTGLGWSAIAENWRLRRKFQHCAFIFPHAPTIPITLVSGQSGGVYWSKKLTHQPNHGMRMPGWFDLSSLSDIADSEDEDGMMQTIRKVHALISEQLNKGVRSDQIVLGGFSQGGAIALLAGLTCKHKLGGIAGLSTWLPLRRKITDLSTEENKTTPIFQAHGESDFVVRYEWGIQTKTILEGELGHQVEWHSYPDLGHSADTEEMTRLEQWLDKVIPAA